MREHVQRVQLLQRGQADRRAHVVGEDQERGPVRDEAAVRGQAVDDRAHRVLAHAEVQVAAGPAGAAGVGALDLLRVGDRRRVEVAEPDEVGEGRRIEVGRTAEQRGHLLADRGEDLLAGDARRQALGVGGEARHVRVPAGWQFAAQALFELPGEIRKGRGVGLHALVPLALGLLAVGLRRQELAAGGLRHEEIGRRRPAQLGLGRGDVVRAQRRAVGLEAVLFWRAVAQVGAHEDQRGARDVGHCGGERAADLLDVVAVGHVQRLPAIGLEAFRAILGERDGGAGRQRDLVVVVQADQLAQLQVTRQRRRLGGDAFHQVAVADEGPGAVVDHGVAGAVVGAGQLRLGDGHADRVGEPLPQRAGGDLDARRVAALRMPRRLAAPLAELLQVVDGQPVAGDVQQAVQQRRPMAGGQHEAIAIGPGRVGGMVLEKARPQDIGHRRGVERQPRVAAVGLLHHVDGEEAQRVDALLVERVGHGQVFQRSDEWGSPP